MRRCTEFGLLPYKIVVANLEVCLVFYVDSVYSLKLQLGEILILNVGS